MKKFSSLSLIIAIVCIFACKALESPGLGQQLKTNYQLSEPISYGAFPKDPEWIYHAPEMIVSTPLVVENKIYVRTSHSLCALDTEFRRELWCADSQGESPISQSPIDSDGKIIIAEEGSQIAAFRMDSGDLVWRKGIDSKFAAQHRIMHVRADADSVFVARYADNLTAYDLITGEAIWVFELPSHTIPYFELSHDKLFLAISDTLLALDPSNGEILWKEKFSDLIGSLGMDSESLYIGVGPKNESLTVLNIDTQREEWSVDAEELGEENIRYIIPHESELFVIGDNLTTIDLKTKEVICSSIDLGPLEKPDFSRNRLFIRNTSNNLYVINVNNCQQLGSLLVQENTHMKREPDRSPVISNDFIYVPFGDDRLFVYKY